MQMKGQEDPSVQWLKNYSLEPSMKFLEKIPKGLTEKVFIESEAQRLKSDYL